MGIKQDCTPSKPNQIGISPLKDIIHGNILWSNTSIDENATINLVVNAMTSTEAMFHIFQQGLGEGTLSFETLDYVIMNISKDINAMTQKVRTQKRKKPKAKTRKIKAGAKVTRKELVKKKYIFAKSSSNSNNEISLPPSKEFFFSMLEVTSKND